MPLVSTKGEPLEVTTIDGYPVEVTTATGTPLEVKLTDVTTEDEVVTIDYAHHEIHEGKHFVASDTVDLGNGAARNYIIISPDSTVEPHVVFNVISESETDIVEYETVTYAAPGTGIAAINRNRRSSNVATTLIYHTPTSPVTTSATTIRTIHWGSGRGVGGDGRGSYEFILKRNTAYMVTVTNATSSNNYISFWVDWYEHDD